MFSYCVGHGIFYFHLARISKDIFMHSQAGPLPLLEWKGEAETDPDTHVGIGGGAQVPEHHTHVRSPYVYGERSALARRPEESLLIFAVPLILVLGFAVADLVAAAAAARSQERALLLLRAALAKFHRQQVSLKRKLATEKLSTL